MTVLTSIPNGASGADVRETLNKALSDLTLLPAPYLGQVANRCYMPRSLSGSTTYRDTRDPVFTTDRVVNPRVGWANWRVASGIESDGPAGVTLTAYLEYPSGVYTLARQNAGGAVAHPVGGVTLLDFDVTIPAYAMVWLWVRQEGPNGQLLRQAQSPTLTVPGQWSRGGTGTPPALLTPMGSSDEFTYPPILFLGMTRRPSVLEKADSREEGGVETIRPPYYDNGAVSPALTLAGIGYTSCAEAASSLNTFINGTSANRSRRLALAPYFSHVLNAWGVNDLQTRTVAQLAADRAAFAALFPQQTVIGTTIYPYVPSTDGWATLANQSISANQNKVRQFNQIARAGIAGETVLLDAARAIDPFDLQKYGISRDPSQGTRATSCVFTGAISTTTLTVSAITSGSLQVGDVINDSASLNAYTTTPRAGTEIMEQLTGTTGSTGTYRVNISQTLSSRSLTTAGFLTNDGLHANVQGASVASERLLPEVRAKVFR